ncbi:XAP5, circadian clock regulator [Nitzschia inconspicua]|uniref:XAP5, circadian clock regulator n=1 Tax=Nitzschia inconspicua TaxID=303405 RepID=A0A9K3LQK2_9STRA|nr:XAP5, circadian clock regulator [Nitzschia inconspicua]
MSAIKGDFHKFHRPDAGARTVEGNTSGVRAARLEQQRLEEQEEFERRKRQRMTENPMSPSLDIGSKFQPARIGSVREQAFQDKTIGLVTAEEFVKATLEKEQLEHLSPEEQARRDAAQRSAEKEKLKQVKKKKKQKKKQAALLSFQSDEDEEEEVANVIGSSTMQSPQSEGKSTATNSPLTTPRASKKDPTVDTSFLPDKQREEELKAERIRLEKEWKERQIQIQKEKLEITYSYWDGSGHRRTCTMTKGSSVGDFLEAVRKSLCGEFKELSNVASDALLYVKEDLILPHDITFYDLIVTKARGKSGPLFHFDVHDDVRVGPLDSRVEKDESHPGKVVERRWYERNKHIFPASRWEVYDPAKTYDKYTIAGGIVTKKSK